MKSKLTLLTLAMVPPLAASAALPPQYQRQREMVAVIESAEVMDALRGEPVDSVSTSADDVYTVTAGACSVDVTIVDRPMRNDGWVGPREFDLSVGEATCLDDEETGRDIK